MPFTQGQVIRNRYRVVKQLTQGGFGRLYRAWDLNLGMPVALKENLDLSPNAIEQFRREAEILAHLSHPNLAKVLDYFYDPELGQFLIMNYVEGQDLDTIVEQNGPVAADVAVGWISQVCEALNYIHSQNPPIIHRDIKPANIRITPEGKAILVDFGIAKTYESTRATTLGARAVTKGYAPVEQYGTRRTDARTDLYALSATLYYLITAQEPLESVQRLSADNLVAPIQHNPQINQSLNWAVLHGMAMTPEHRFQTAHDFQLSLNNSITHPIVYTKPARWVEWVLILFALVAGLVATGRAFEALLVGLIYNGQEISGALLDVSDLLQSGGVVLFDLAAIGTFVAFLVWVYISAGLIISAGNTLKFSPAWAVGGFLVPIVNLWHPYRVMSDFWKSSDPEFGGRVAPAPIKVSPLIPIWWVCGLLWTALMISGVVLSLVERSLELIMLLVVLVLAANLMLMVTAFLSFLAVRGVNQRLATARRTW